MSMFFFHDSPCLLGIIIGTKVDDKLCTGLEYKVVLTLGYRR